MASVLVVGAGLAGLACAWRLQRAGFDVELLERATAPGGRARSRTRDGFLIAPGFGTASSRDHALHGLARQLGIEHDVQSIHRFPDAIDTGRDFAALRPVEDPLFVRTHALRRGESLRLGRLRVEVLRWRRALDPPTANTIRTLDGQPVADWLDRTIGPELRRNRVMPYATALAGSNAEGLSALAFLRYAQRLRAARPQYLVGGLGALANRIAAGLNVRFGCEVVAIESQDDGARVRYRATTAGGVREGRAMADAVVLATIGPSIDALCPKLAPAERGFFESLSYARRTVVHLLLDAPPEIPHRLVAFPPREGFGVASLEAAHHMRGAAPTGAGLLRVVLSEAAGDRIWRASDDEVAGVVLDNLERTSVGRLAPSAVEVDRLAQATPIAGPGFFTRLARFSNRVERTPRMAFAGEAFVGQGAEAAIASGLHAASEIAHTLPARR